MKGYIWFDMDGTIADFYNVEGWLNDLENFSVRPYEEAKMIYPFVDFIETLGELKLKGYKLGVVSWLAKNPDKVYAQRVTLAKEKWLKKYLISDLLDTVIIAPYGTNKSKLCEEYGKGILVDDEKPNLDSWQNGKTINANENILKILQKMA